MGETTVVGGGILFTEDFRLVVPEVVIAFTLTSIKILYGYV